VISMSWDEVRARRLAGHLLSEPAPADQLVDVAGRVGGIQAQVMASAELGIGLRVADITRTDVREELWGRRALVKTYAMRGTIHLFPAAEFAMWLAALNTATPPTRSPVAPDPNATPAEQMRELVAAIAEALDGEELLTREELGEEIVRRAGAWARDEVIPAFGTAWPRWTSAIGAAAAAGQLCFGPNRGNRVTFVRPDRWLGSAALAPVDGDAALQEVFRRYLRAFGPATPGDFAQWFYMGPRAAEALARTLGPEVTEVDVEGRTSMALADDIGRPRHPSSIASGSVHLLPPFDAFVIGSHPRGRLMPSDLLDRLGKERIRSMWARRALSGGTVANIPVLLVDGVVGGVWERRNAGKRLEVRVEPFAKLTADQRRRVERQATRIGEILERDVTFELGTVEVRPHL
jgi:hypothetical protein